VTTVQSLIQQLDVIAPWDKAAEWDPVGLQVGDLAATVGTVGVCHDVTHAVLDAAVSAEVGFLVSYHPILFEPTRRFVAGSGPAGIAHRAATLGVGIGVVHTAFDVAPGGAADTLAAALGLRDTTGFGPVQTADAEFGIVDRGGSAGFVGRVGTWTGSLAELSRLVSTVLDAEPRMSGDADRQLERVAVVPGSGASLIAGASAVGADALVTGDVKHHDARLARAGGLAILDPGHAATERPGVAKLYAAVAAEWDDTIDLTGVDADPWKT